MASCEEIITQLQHTDQACITEGGRVRAVAFGQAPGVATHTIAETSGSYNGGDPEYGDGYGDEAQRMKNRNHELVFKDPSMTPENSAFWNGMALAHWYVGFKTETMWFWSDKPATVVPKTVVDDDLGSDVVFEVTCTWKSKSMPTPGSES